MKTTLAITAAAILTAMAVVGCNRNNMNSTDYATNSTWTATNNMETTTNMNNSMMNTNSMMMNTNQ